MRRHDVYVDLDGHEIALAGLDAGERRLVARLRRRAQTHPDWTDFDNYWTRQLRAFYDPLGASRRVVRESAPFRIALDLSGRLGIAAGLVRPDDYLGDLEDLIREKFPSRRAFCEATGLAEDMLSHVLAGRKHYTIDTLAEGLERIGYTLRIRPVQPAARKRTG
jgi:hypothetical protein